MFFSQIKYIEEAISKNDLSKKRKNLNKWKLIDHLKEISKYKNRW